MGAEYSVAAEAARELKQYGQVGQLVLYMALPSEAAPSQMGAQAAFETTQIRNLEQLYSMIHNDEDEYQNLQKILWSQSQPGVQNAQIFMEGIFHISRHAKNMDHKALVFKLTSFLWERCDRDLGQGLRAEGEKELDDIIVASGLVDALLNVFKSHTYRENTGLANNVLRAVMRFAQSETFAKQFMSGQGPQHLIDVLTDHNLDEGLHKNTILGLYLLAQWGRLKLTASASHCKEIYKLLKERQSLLRAACATVIADLCRHPDPAVGDHHRELMVGKQNILNQLITALKEEVETFGLSSAADCMTADGEDALLDVMRSLHSLLCTDFARHKPECIERMEKFCSEGMLELSSFMYQTEGIAHTAPKNKQRAEILSAYHTKNLLRFSVCIRLLKKMGELQDLHEMMVDRGLYRGLLIVQSRSGAGEKEAKLAQGSIEVLRLVTQRSYFNKIRLVQENKFPQLLMNLRSDRSKMCIEVLHVLDNIVVDSADPRSESLFKEITTNGIVDALCSLVVGVSQDTKATQKGIMHTDGRKIVKMSVMILLRLTRDRENALSIAQAISVQHLHDLLLVSEDPSIRFYTSTLIFNIAWWKGELTDNYRKTGLLKLAFQYKLAISKTEKEREEGTLAPTYRRLLILHEMATLIQKVHRGKAVRKQYAVQRRRVVEKRAVLKIGKWWRGLMFMRALRKAQKARRDIWDEAVQLKERMAKALDDRMEIAYAQLQRDRLMAQQRWDCTEKIQRVFRGYLARKDFIGLVYESRLKARAANDISRMYRGHLGRKYASLLREQRRLEEHRVREGAVATIERFWVGVKARERSVVLRQERREFLALLGKCASVIGSIGRGHFGRLKFAAQWDARTRYVAAREIQRTWRGMKGRRRGGQLRGERDVYRARRHEAAVQIQRIFRGWSTRRELERLLEREHNVVLREIEEKRNKLHRDFVKDEKKSRNGIESDEAQEWLKLAKSANKLFRDLMERVVEAELQQEQEIARERHEGVVAEIRAQLAAKAVELERAREQLEEDELEALRLQQDSLADQVAEVDHRQEILLAQFRERQRREFEAVTSIVQRFGRGHLGRVRAGEGYNYVLVKHGAAAKIQGLVRGHLCREILVVKIARAIEIQRVWRGHHSTIRVAHLRRLRDEGGDTSTSPSLAPLDLDFDPPTKPTKEGKRFKGEKPKRRSRPPSAASNGIPPLTPKESDGSMVLGWSPSCQSLTRNDNEHSRDVQEIAIQTSTDDLGARPSPTLPHQPLFPLPPPSSKGSSYLVAPLHMPPPPSPSALGSEASFLADDLALRQVLGNPAPITGTGVSTDGAEGGENASPEHPDFQPPRHRELSDFATKFGARIGRRPLSGTSITSPPPAAAPAPSSREALGSTLPLPRSLSPTPTLGAPLPPHRPFSVGDAMGMGLMEPNNNGHSAPPQLREFLTSLPIPHKARQALHLPLHPHPQATHQHDHQNDNHTHHATLVNTRGSRTGGEGGGPEIDHHLGVERKQLQQIQDILDKQRQLYALNEKVNFKKAQLLFQSHLRTELTSLSNPKGLPNGSGLSSGTKDASLPLADASQPAAAAPCNHPNDPQSTTLPHPSPPADTMGNATGDPSGGIQGERREDQDGVEAGEEAGEAGEEDGAMLDEITLKIEEVFQRAKESGVEVPRTPPTKAPEFSHTTTPQPPMVSMTRPFVPLSVGPSLAASEYFKLAAAGAPPRQISFQYAARELCEEEHFAREQLEWEEKRVRAQQTGRFRLDSASFVQPRGQSSTGHHPTSSSLSHPTPSSDKLQRPPSGPGRAGANSTAKQLTQGEILSKLFSNDPYLKELNLKGLGMTDVMAYPIFRALRGNNIVHSVDLSDNELSDATAVAIGEQLEGNRSLTAINLDGNDLSNIGAQTLLGVIDRHPPLGRVSLRRQKHPVSPVLINSINVSLSRNVLLQLGPVPASRRTTTPPTLTGPQSRYGASHPEGQQSGSLNPSGSGAALLGQNRLVEGGGFGPSLVPTPLGRPPSGPMLAHQLD